MLSEVDVFEETNWDFTDKFSNTLGNIKVLFSQRFYNFKRVEKLLKIINYSDDC